MKCDHCDRNLTPIQPKYESPANTDVVTCVQKLICTNSKCDRFAGSDLNNPKQIAKTIKTEV